MNRNELHVHQSSGAARLLEQLPHITSGQTACATDVRLHASPTTLDTLLPLDGSLCNFISFIGLVTDLVYDDEDYSSRNTRFVA